MSDEGRTAFVLAEISINPRQLAEWFVSLDDDEQARFFVEVAALMGEWQPGAGKMQLAYIGGHLCECECSTPAARDWVLELAEHIRTGMGATT